MQEVKKSPEKVLQIMSRVCVLIYWFFDNVTTLVGSDYLEAMGYRFWLRGIVLDLILAAMNYRKISGTPVVDPKQRMKYSF